MFDGSFLSQVPWSILFDLGSELLAVGMSLWLVAKGGLPQATLAWIFAFFLFPYVAPALYWYVGEHAVRRRAQRRQRRRRVQWHCHPGASARPEGELARDVLRHLDTFNPFPARPGNRVEITADGERYFEELFAALAGAERRILIEMYIVRTDATGERLRRILMERAAAGVEVVLLYDHVGSLLFHHRWVRSLRRAGVAIAPFNPVRLLPQRFSPTLRNHRKIVVVDGRIAFTGGMNVGDEYRTGDSPAGPWRDLGIRIEGPAVADLEAVVLRDWRLATGRRLEPSPPPEPYPDGSLLQVVPGGPDDAYEPVRLLFSMLCGRAERSLTMVTPYYAPDPALAYALEAAAMRGLRVDLLLPGRSDVPWAGLASEAFAVDLARAGGKIWRCQGMVHAKAILCDRELAVVGSANFDSRSFRVNYEVVVVCYDERELAAVAAELGRLRRTATSWGLREWEARWWPARFLGGLARLTGPLL